MDSPSKKAGPKKPTANQIKRAFSANLQKGQVKKNIQILRSGLPQKQPAQAQKAAQPAEPEFTTSSGTDIPEASENITSSGKLTNVKVAEQKVEKKIDHDMEEWIVFPHSSDKPELEESKTHQQDNLVELNERLTKTKEQIENSRAHVANLQLAYKQATDAGEAEQAGKIARQIEDTNASIESTGEYKETLEHTVFEADKNLKEITERLHSEHGESPSLMATAQIGAAVGGFKLGKWIVNKVRGKKETPVESDDQKIEVTSSQNVANIGSDTGGGEDDHTSVKMSEPSSTSTSYASSNTDLPTTPEEIAVAMKSPRGSLRLLNKFKKFGKTGIQGAAVTGASAKAFKAGGALTALLYGIMMHFAALGKAALVGAQIGAVVGGAVGTGAGAYIGLMFAGACGPAALLCGALTVPTMAFLGGSMGAVIGALAGGLIGLGIASGSATLVSMGIGAGAGGAIGGALGFYAGTAIGATVASGLIGLAVAACAATLIGCALVPIATIAAPFIVAGSALVGTIVGAAVGALVGAAVGYVIGEYVLDPVKNAYTGATTKIRGGWDTLTGGGGIGGTVGGWLGGTWNFITGAIPGWAAGSGSTVAGWTSAAWNGTISAGGNALSGAASAAGDIFGSIVGGGGGQILARIPAISTGGTVASALGYHMLVGTFITPATKFTSDLDPIENYFPPGVNEIFSVSKTANPTTLGNLGGPVEFRIEIRATKNITTLTITDTLTIGTNVTNPSVSCPTPMAAGSAPCIRTFTQDVSGVSDTTVTNSVTVTATADDLTTATDTATAIVRVGDAPEGCPSGWPTARGGITQGPLGSTSHARLYPGEQAIDIGLPAARGDQVRTTFSGTVRARVDTHTPGVGYGIYVDVSGNCNGVPFTARWAHLESINSSVPAVDQPISVNTDIGPLDRTGNVTCGGIPGCDPSHLHYSFFGLTMGEPYIPAGFSW